MSRARRRAREDGGQSLLELIFSVTALGSVGVLTLAGVFGVLLNERIQEEREALPQSDLAAVAGKVKAGEIPFVPCASPQDYGRFMPLQVKVAAVANWDGTQFRPGSRLSADIEDSATSFPLADEGSGFVDAGEYRVKIGNELVQVHGDDAPAALEVTRPSLPERHYQGDEVAYCPERERLQRVTLQMEERGQTFTAVVVKPGPLALPKLTAPTASFEGAAGAATFTASVHLTEGENPTGSLVFKLFGPGNADCSGEPAAQFPVTTVTGAGDYSVDKLPVPAQAAGGDYRWHVTYEGDAANQAIAGACDLEAPPLTLTSANGATLVGTASAEPVAIGGETSDVATLAGLVGVSPSGSVTFSLFAPDDPSCVGMPVAVSAPAPVTGDGTYRSGPFRVSTAGKHHWVATYSGDASNGPSTTACGVEGQDVMVRWAPSISLTSDGTATTSTAVSTTSTLAGTSPAPGGEIVIELFTDSVCATAPSFASRAPVAAPATTGGVLVQTAGRYYVRATYTGDAENAGVSSGCGPTAPQVTVRATPSLSVITMPGDLVGWRATSALSNGSVFPAGMVTYSFYATPDCTGTPTPAGTAQVSETPPLSDPQIPPAPGTYSWSATYSGDPNNLPATSNCAQVTVP